MGRGILIAALSLGTILGFASGFAHVFGHRDGRACSGWHREAPAQPNP
jgi:hypothetical protein